MHIVTNLVLPPGACKLCGSGNKEWYLDTETQEEFLGAVYYCCDCIGHLAAVCGFIPLARVHSQIQGLNEALKFETEERIRYESLFRTLSADVASHPIASGASQLTLSYDEVVVESTLLNGDGEGETAESSDEQHLAGDADSKPESPAFSLFGN